MARTPAEHRNATDVWRQAAPKTDGKIWARKSDMKLPHEVKAAAPVVPVLSRQVTRNLRAALPSADAVRAGAGVALDYAHAADREKIDHLLGALDLLTVAHRGLLTGEDLEEIGGDAPYKTAAQKRAWAAGKLSAALSAIRVAQQIIARQERLLSRIRSLEVANDNLRAEVRAASRFGSIDVPFREPRPTGRVDWLLDP